MSNFKHINAAFDPKASKAAKAARQAEQEIKGALSAFKSLYYGLRSLWWQSLDKGEIWRDAYQKGEMDQYILAPGYRDSEGFYTPAEYDMERINQDFWPKKRQEFYEQFEAEFWVTDLNQVPSKESALKHIQGRTRHLLKVALETFEDKLVDQESDVDPLLQVRLALAEINQANLDKLNYRRDQQSKRVSVKHAETVMSRETNGNAQNAEAWLAAHADDLPPAELDGISVMNGHC